MLELASAMVARLRDKPQGWLRISASVVIGKALLPALVAEFASLHPGVQLCVNLASHRIGPLLVPA